MKKQILILTLIITTVCTLTACGGNSGNIGNGSGNGAANAPVAPPTASDISASNIGETDAVPSEFANIPIGYNNPRMNSYGGILSWQIVSDGKYSYTLRSHGIGSNVLQTIYSFDMHNDSTLWHGSGNGKVIYENYRDQGLGGVFFIYSIFAEDGKLYVIYDAIDIDKAEQYDNSSSNSTGIGALIDIADALEATGGGTYLMTYDPEKESLSHILIDPAMASMRLGNFIKAGDWLYYQYFAGDIYDPKIEIRRMSIADGRTESIVPARQGKEIGGFEISGDRIFYNIAEVDEKGLPVNPLSGQLRCVMTDGSGDSILYEELRGHVFIIDDRYCYFNDRDAGHLLRIPVEGGSPEIVITGFSSNIYEHCNIIDDKLYYAADKNAKNDGSATFRIYQMDLTSQIGCGLDELPYRVVDTSHNGEGSVDNRIWLFGESLWYAEGDQICRINMSSTEEDSVLPDSQLGRILTQNIWISNGYRSSDTRAVMFLGNGTYVETLVIKTPPQGGTYSIDGDTVTLYDSMGLVVDVLDYSTADGRLISRMHEVAVNELIVDGNQEWIIEPLYFAQDTGGSYSDVEIFFKKFFW